MTNKQVKQLLGPMIIAFAAFVGVPGLCHGDLLEYVPAQAAIVVVIRDPDALSRRLTQFIHKIKPDGAVMTVDRLFEDLGLPAGSINGRTPVAVVIPDVSDLDDPPVVVFRPQEIARWQPAAGDPAPLVAKVTLAECDRPRFVSIQNGWTIVGSKQTTVGRFIRATKRGALHTALSQQERSLCERSDAFVHFSMDQWQGKVSQALGIMRLIGSGATMASDSAESQVQFAVLEWLATGLSSISADMNVTALGFNLDDRGARFTHLHSFRPDSGVAHYLKQTQRQDIDVWGGLNQQAFLAAFAWNWRNPADAGVMVDMMNRITSASCKTAATQPASDELIGDCRAYYGRLLSAATVIDLSPDCHMQVWGTSRFEDAKEGIRLLREISMKSDQMMSSFAPTWASSGTFETSKRDGLEIQSMSFCSRKLPERERQMVDALYGPGASYQIAALDNQLVGYCVAADNDTIVDMAKAAHGRSGSLSQVPAVASMMKALPEGPALVAIADVDRVTRFAPHLAALDSKIEQQRHIKGRTGGNPDLTKTSAAPPAPRASAHAEPPATRAAPGPLIGWALMVGPTWVRGEAYMSQDDIVRSVPLVKRMSQQFAAADPTPPARPTRTKIRIERRQSP